MIGQLLKRRFLTTATRRCTLRAGNSRGREERDSERPLPEPRFYQQLAAAFDAPAISSGHESGPAANRLMLCQRQRSLALLATTFTKQGWLLEIGCGTGEEAIALARLGHRVFVTDVSPAMVARTLANAQRAGVGDRITGRPVAAAQLIALEHDPFMPTFDGAFSSFGALNCEPALGAVAASLSRILRPGTSVVISVINRWNLWDPCWFGLHGDLRRACRRVTRGWLAARIGSSGPFVPLRYLDAATIARTFSDFVVERVVGLGVLLPPPHLDAVFSRWPYATRLLDALDRRLMAWWPFNRLGDHVAIVLRRRESGWTGSIPHPTTSFLTRARPGKWTR